MTEPEVPVGDEPTEEPAPSEQPSPSVEPSLSEEQEALLTRLEERLTEAERAGIVADGGWFAELARTKLLEDALFETDARRELEDLERRHTDSVPTVALAHLTWWVEGYPELRSDADLRGEQVDDAATAVRLEVLETPAATAETEPEPEPETEPEPAPAEEPSGTGATPWVVATVLLAVVALVLLVLLLV